MSAPVVDLRAERLRRTGRDIVTEARGPLEPATEEEIWAIMRDTRDTLDRLADSTAIGRVDRLLNDVERRSAAHDESRSAGLGRVLAGRWPVAPQEAVR